MKQLDFIRSLTSKPIINESLLSYEDALLARLDKETDLISDTGEKDTITFDVPLLIRVFELVREDVKTDMDLHNIVEKLISLKNKGTLTMADYEKISAAQGGQDSGQMPKTDESLDVAMIRMLAGLKTNK
jgi:hypothetical protein